MKTQAERMHKVIIANSAAFGRPVILHIGDIDITGITGFFSTGYTDERLHGTGNTGGYPINPEDYILQLETQDVIECKLSKGHEVTIEEVRYRIIDTPKPDRLGLTKMSIRAIQ